MMSFIAGYELQIFINLYSCTPYITVFMVVEEYRSVDLAQASAFNSSIMISAVS